MKKYITNVCTFFLDWLVGVRYFLIPVKCHCGSVSFGDHAGWPCIKFQREEFLKAIVEWEPLAEQGDAGAQFNLGYCFFKGEGFKEDRTQAIRWFTLAANNGEVRAQRQLGEMYASEKDFSQSEKWYSLAAEQGDGLALFKLGHMYMRGEGVTQSLTEGLKHYLLAAEQDELGAYMTLGNIYHQGLDTTSGSIEIDHTEAFKWFSYPAERGVDYAQCKIGKMYEEGKGVEQNIQLAHMWYTIAVAMGSWKAKNQRYAISEELTAGQVVDSQRRAMQYLKIWPIDNDKQAVTFLPR